MPDRPETIGAFTFDLDSVLIDSWPHAEDALGLADVTLPGVAAVGTDVIERLGAGT